MSGLTHNPTPLLLCTAGDHVSSIPRVSAAGATGPVLCAECGAPMALIDAITVRRADELAWSSPELGVHARWRRYFS